MPAISEKQRRFFGAELARKRKGKKTRTGLGETTLREFASKPLAKKNPAPPYGKNGCFTVSGMNAFN